MNNKIIFFLVTLFLVNSLLAQEIIKLDGPFNKIIVSPHIETIFIKGNEPSIEIKDIIVPAEKFKYELTNNTLQVYLEGAKTYTKNKKIIYDGYERKVPLYKERVAQIIITYTDVSIFSVRGEENVLFKSPLDQQKCALRFYGNAKVEINDMKLDELIIDIYGNSFLNVHKGSTLKQKIRAYGASTIMATNLKSKETKISAYGDGNYQLNVSERIKIDAYGEATILYKGEADFKKGIIIGESTIRKI